MKIEHIELNNFGSYEESNIFDIAASDDKRIVIIGGKNGKILDYCFPCGSCRQVLSEFCDDTFKILLFK